MYSVQKANKTFEPYSEEKVIDSIRRAHIHHSIQGKVLAHVNNKMYDGITTREIYHHITEFLGDTGDHYAKARYSLKEAIMNLGPTGYPFEDFISKLLQEEGYHTKVRQVLRGECITHEIDVIAEKGGKSAMIEAKYHNSPGIRSQVHVALYTQARFVDIKNKNHIDEAWIITNTKTTTEVNAYAQCKNMKAISWSYPEGNSLRDMIERLRLYPVTMLSSLSSGHKRILLNNHIVLCKEIYKDNSLIKTLYLSENDYKNVIAEVNFVCKQG
ncbi:MAG TPA: restriction endonuclease [Candidatus Limnocylindrales bacterium]|nr:restriction endonuclease [Candidatus Limnocylindrales bacterium]